MFPWQTGSARGVTERFDVVGSGIVYKCAVVIAMMKPAGRALQPRTSMVLLRVLPISA